MYCDHGNEPGLVLLTGRAAAVDHGVPHPALVGYSERFRAREQRLSAQLQAAFPDQLATEGEIGFWPGCDAIDKGADDIAAALALFERTGVGREDRRRAAGVRAAIRCSPPATPICFAGTPGASRSRSAASSKVAINCSACLYAMRAQYAAEGVSVRAEIVSLADLLAPAAAQPRVPADAQDASTTTTPATTRATTRSIEQPRRALAQLAEVRELAWNKEDTECCGGGGLLPKTMPQVADQMSKRRLAEVQAHGRRHGRHLVCDLRLHAQAKRPAVGRGREPRDRDGEAVRDAVHRARDARPTTSRSVTAQRPPPRPTRSAPSRTTRAYHRPRAGSASRLLLRSANDSTICLHGDAMRVSSTIDLGAERAAACRPRAAVHGRPAIVTFSPVEPGKIGWPSACSASDHLERVQAQRALGTAVDLRVGVTVALEAERA